MADAFLKLVTEEYRGNMVLDGAKRLVEGV